MKKALFILTDDFSDWEGAFLSSILNKSEEWKVQTVSTKRVIKSIGGLTVKIDTILEPNLNCDLVVMIGGNNWKLQEKNMYLFIKNKIHEQIKIAAICGAVDFLAYNGFLNTFNHTGNSQKLWINYDEYQPQKTFIKNNVVTDRNLVTANGTSPIDFTLATLKMINFDNDYEIERKMNLYRLGYYKYMHFYS
ncbi:DJ-1/PfpI family protein [Staphylococcus haemolyticus]|uniref:DJ-1/PfpI family protein n=2 Tax=Staphylococcus haemolyticus TaxID=1283 RepID=UPI00069FAF64|nr:DJ-1/PfpI family protein [Staphylococcus haemolyticus]